MNVIKIQRWQSPCGELVLGGFGDRLCMCDWGRHRVISRLTRSLDAVVTEAESEVVDNAIAQLKEYFTGRRKVFDLPLLMPGTAFQQIVWNAICHIGYGHSMTYGGLSGMIGRQTSVRAVANAVGANAISVIVPCHRIIGSGGQLTGYAGRISAKGMLLGLEAGNVQSLFSDSHDSYCGTSSAG